MDSGESERINVSELLRRAQEREQDAQSDLTISPNLGPTSPLEINSSFIDSIMDVPSSRSLESEQLNEFKTLKRS